MAASDSAIPFLRSCKQETERPIQGDKKGEIPGWVKGCLIRIGSGLLEIGPDRFNHVFDGMALLHRFEFGEGGRVTYQNRFLRSDSYTNNIRANRIVVSEFATRGAPDPCKTIFQRLSSFFDMDNMTDNDLVNVVMYGGEAYACSETNNVWRIDTDTLESLKKVNLRDYVPVDGAIAHAHEDSDGTVYNIGTSYGFYSHYNILKFTPNKPDEGCAFEGGSVVCRLPASRPLRPSYYHSFAMTREHFVLVEQPLYLSLPRMAWAHFVAGTYADAMTWDPDTPSRFHVVSRESGGALTTPYVAAPFFVFHHINAYEEEGHLVVDLCGYADGRVLGALYVEALRRAAGADTTAPPFQSEARRYVLPLHVDPNTVKGKNLVSLKNSDATAILQPDGTVFCTYEVLTGKDRWSPELPRIHYERCNGRKYRYFYAIARKEEASQQTYLIKVDGQTKRTLSWCERDAIPSEPVFLQQPDTTDESEEDSGVLLASLLYQNDESKVSALVLDARTMQEMGRVTYKTDSSVPGDFHGIFLSKS